MRTKLLIATIILAAILRFWNLGQNPPSLNWDEIAIGYNAYSLLQTGKDEFGVSWPTTFRSFDDYKSPAYIYSTVLSLAIFGKTEFAIRFSSAFFGTLTVIIFYFFTRQLLLSSKIKDSKLKIVWYNRSSNIALLSTFLLAISPWHVHFSRVAFESNFALFWEILASWLFLLHIRENNKLSYLIYSVISFSIALYSYANARLFVALLLIGWSYYYLNQIKHKLMQIFGASLLGLLLISVLISQMFTGSGLARYEATAITNRPEIYTRNDLFAKQDFDSGQGRLSSLVHNYRIPIFQQILQNYTSHFSYNFLFIRADLPRHHIPGIGLLYSWQLPLLLIGLVFLIKSREYLQVFPTLWWFLISPVGAALTWQVPHSIRTELMLPVLTIFSGIGLWVILKFIQTQDLKIYTLKTNNQFDQIKKKLGWCLPKLSFISIIFILVVSVVSMVINYTVLLPKEFSKYWLYGRKEMVEYILEEKPKYQKVVVSQKIEWGYLWFLWYGPYTPQQYLSQGGTVSGGFEETQNKIGNIEFHPFPFDSGSYQSKITDKSTIYVGVPEDFPSTLVPDKIINDLSGKPIIYIVKT